MMDLLLVAGDFPPDVGGIQRYVVELSCALAQAGWELAVVAPERAAAAEVDAELPFPVVRQAIERGGRFSEVLGLRAGLSRLRRRFGRPRAVVATKWSPDGLAVVASGAGRGVPLVLLGYGREFLTPPGGMLRRWAQSRVLKRTALALAISHYTEENFGRAAGLQAPVEVIFGGVRGGDFRDDEAAAAVRQRLGLEGRPVILTVGRLVRRKGHDTVIRAMRGILAERPEAVYVVVGSGPEEQRLRELAQREGVAENVLMCGRIGDDELPAVHRAADVFVMVSREEPGEPTEGFGLVYLEANAAERPVVAADTGGVADAVVHEETGLLIPESAPGPAGAAIGRLLRDRELAGRLGRQGRERVERAFTWEHVAQRFGAALDRHLGITPHS